MQRWAGEEPSTACLPGPASLPWPALGRECGPASTATGVLDNERPWAGMEERGREVGRWLLRLPAFDRGFCPPALSGLRQLPLPSPWAFRPILGMASCCCGSPAFQLPPVVPPTPTSVKATAPSLRAWLKPGSCRDPLGAELVLRASQGWGIPTCQLGTTTTPTPHFPTEVGSSTVFLLEALEQPVHRDGASCQLSVGVQLPNGSRARDMPRSQLGRGAGPSATPWRPGGGGPLPCVLYGFHTLASRPARCPLLLLSLQTAPTPPLPFPTSPLTADVELGGTRSPPVSDTSGSVSTVMITSEEAPSGHCWHPLFRLLR